MEKSILKEINQAEKSPQKLSENSQDDSFQRIEYHQRANSDPTLTIDSNSNLNSDNEDIIQYMRIDSNNSSTSIENNPINQQCLKSENPEKTAENKANEESTFNPINGHITENFKNKNAYSFNGPNLNNVKNYYENNRIGNYSNNNLSLIPIQSNIRQKMDEFKQITQLKDEFLKYRCTKCGFLSTESDEFHKHLSFKQHFFVPKNIKNKKMNIYYNNKTNQTFIPKMRKKCYFCKYCGKRFDSKITLYAHLKAHRCNCAICLRLFNSKEGLPNHNYNHNRGFNHGNKKNNLYKKNKNKSSENKNKTEVDDSHRKMSSNKKVKWENDDVNDINDFEQTYAFVEDSEDNFDFNKMVKIGAK